MIPAAVRALTLAGFIRRSSMQPSDVNGIESKSPGFVQGQAVDVQEEVYDQLRKRYLVDSLGQVMGPPSARGTNPPPITFLGVPVSGDLEIVITITTSGPIGVAAFSWSKDGGQTQVATDVVTATAVPLPGTGITVLFPFSVGGSAAAYFTDNVYVAATPVPRIVLRWITSKLTVAVWERRGVNPQDPQIAAAVARAAKADEQIAQAANSKDGLFDLPLNVDTGGSGVTQGGPLAYSETSPYAWQDIQAGRGHVEDHERIIR